LKSDISTYTHAIVSPQIKLRLRRLMEINLRRRQSTFESFIRQSYCASDSDSHTPA